MPYRIALSEIAVLKKDDPSAYRPLLDFVEPQEAPEDAERARTWTEAKERVLDYLNRLKHAKRWQLGKPVPIQSTIFENAPPRKKEKALKLSELEKRQLETYTMRQLSQMTRRMRNAKMENVDSRHRGIPF